MRSEKQRDSKAITVRRCVIADKEHEISERQYAHVHHLSDNIICIAEAWVMLSLETEMGLIAHEIGHLLAGHTSHSELEADRLGDNFFKVTIKYRNTVDGNRLQFLTHRDTMKVYEWVLDNVKFEGKLFA